MNHIVVYRLFELDKNTWHHKTVGKQVLIDTLKKRNFKKCNWKYIYDYNLLFISGKTGNKSDNIYIYIYI